MKEAELKLLVVYIVIGCFMAAGTVYAGPYFRLDREQEWRTALETELNIEPMTPTEWQAYMEQWSDPDTEREGAAYPNNPFLPAQPPTGQLYVYGGGGGGGTEPNDAGLVMLWGDPCTPDGNYCSAYKYDYQLDPDLSNCTITVTVTAPQFDLAGNQINQVSLGLQNAPAVGGPIRAWFWNCGPAPAPIPWNVPTKITIDTSKVGLGAATPQANGYMNNLGFNLKLVQFIIVDENGAWVGGGTPAPAPGSGLIGMWNYWHGLMVSPNTTLSKGYYIKWSQPPVVVDENDPPVFTGWDEYSDYNEQPLHIVADDWNCTDDRPITDIHWWGSFIGWNQPYPPPVVPLAFHIGIWTDVPADPCIPGDFSHPNVLIWENYCDNFVWNFAGYDKDPRDKDPCEPFEPNDSCFQYNQLLSQDEWFYQEPDPCDPNGRIYWLSIAPIWDPCRPEPRYQWGWKTRPHHFQDDAVSMQAAPWWPPVVGVTTWTNGVPIQWPPWPDPLGTTWDMAFELTTNEPDPNKPASPDLNYDGIVDFRDFAIMADWWLTAGP